MPHTSPDDWLPHGIDELEPAAWKALRHSGSASVVAGPGAGKTEFLAQKVSYLLETGACAAPRRILAISFKTDAARNLDDRVRRRCPPHLARRFVSSTFDAFTKGLVDHFLSGLPERWRPTRGYGIVFPGRRDVAEFLETARRAAPQRWQDPVGSLVVDEFQAYADRYRMPTGAEEAESPAEFVIERWWRFQLDGASSKLTFGTLNRLAELLLRVRPQIGRALRNTYPFVLVDEFQDTTDSQYEVLTTAFNPASTAITAVGDLKQGIMRWAGAMDDPFHAFDAQFGATRFNFAINHRSSPGLIQIQYIVARHLDANVEMPDTTKQQQIDGDVAQIWTSVTVEAEAEHLAEWIAADRTARGLSPRDYALLVRQKPVVYATQLASAFERVGLAIRNESEPLGKVLLQDLMADDFARAAAAALRLGASQRAPDAWVRASRSVQSLHAPNPDDPLTSRRADARLQSFADRVTAFMGVTPPAPHAAEFLAREAFDLLDREAIARLSPAHGRGGLLPLIEEAFTRHFVACADRADSWREVLDAYEGVDRVPLMTIHKSKGLEFDTVLFVGLDDGAWWSHKKDPEVSTFFVALSRAQQRAIFLFCEERGERAEVADLYEMLVEAGVQETQIGI